MKSLLLLVLFLLPLVGCEIFDSPSGMTYREAQIKIWELQARHDSLQDARILELIDAVNALTELHKNPYGTYQQPIPALETYIDSAWEIIDTLGTGLVSADSTR